MSPSPLDNALPRQLSLLGYFKHAANLIEKKSKASEKKLTNSQLVQIAPESLSRDSDRRKMQSIKSRTRSKPFVPFPLSFAF